MESLKAIFLAFVIFISQLFGGTTSIVSEPPVPVVIMTTSSLTGTSSTTKETFIDPEGRYTIIIPQNMTYRYSKEDRALYLWSGKDQGQEIEFSVSFLTDEEFAGYAVLTKEEINRTLLNEKDKIDVYDPYATEACHEEAKVKIKSGGYIQFYNRCGDEKGRTLFDQIILGTKILP